MSIDRLEIISLGTFTIFIHITETDHCIGIALLCRLRILSSMSFHPKRRRQKRNVRYHDRKKKSRGNDVHYKTPARLMSIFDFFIKNYAGEKFFRG